MPQQRPRLVPRGGVEVLPVDHLDARHRVVRRQPHAHLLLVHGLLLAVDPHDVAHLHLGVVPRPRAVLHDVGVHLLLVLRPPGLLRGHLHRGVHPLPVVGVHDGPQELPVPRQFGIALQALVHHVLERPDDSLDDARVGAGVDELDLLGSEETLDAPPVPSALVVGVDALGAPAQGLEAVHERAEEGVLHLGLHGLHRHELREGVYGAHCPRVPLLLLALEIGHEEEVDLVLVVGARWDPGVLSRQVVLLLVVGRYPLLHVLPGDRGIQPARRLERVGHAAKTLWIGVHLLYNGILCIHLYNTSRFISSLPHDEVGVVAYVVVGRHRLYGRRQRLVHQGRVVGHALPFLRARGRSRAYAVGSFEVYVILHDRPKTVRVSPGLQGQHQPTVLPTPSHIVVVYRVVHGVHGGSILCSRPTPPLYAIAHAEIRRRRWR